jgi:uncharacterized paraquat-inducible protein A
VALFIVIVVGVWDNGFLIAQGIATASILLPVSYLVLLLMIRQRREQRRYLKKLSSTVRDDEL